MSFLYRITSPSGKAYIGVAKHSAAARFKKHCYDAKEGRKTALCNAIRKYGPESMRVETLVEASSDYCFALEKKAIVHLNSIFPDGYNMTYGGEGVHKMDADTAARHKISVNSPEVKRKRLEATQKYWNDPESKVIASQVMRDRWKDDNWRGKFSQAMVEKWKDPVYRAKQYVPVSMKCVQCGAGYECTIRQKHNSKYCSDSCKKKAFYLREKERFKDERI